MNVDMKVLEALTIDRDIPLDRLIVAIEIAVKTAYNEMEGAKPFAHAKLDRVTGEIKIIIPVFGPDCVAINIKRISKGVIRLDLLELAECCR